MKLNKNQLIVLDWLKNQYTGNADPFGVVACLFSQTPHSEVIIASLKLTKAEQAQVLQKFMNWILTDGSGVRQVYVVYDETAAVTSVWESLDDAQEEAERLNSTWNDFVYTAGHVDFYEEVEEK